VKFERASLPAAMVTGVSGLLGANFAMDMSSRYRLTGIYHDHPVTVPGVTTVRVDLSSAADCRSLLDRVRPERIFHFAAATNVDWCEEHRADAWRINVEGTRTLAEWTAARGGRLIYMSTDAVFDGVRGGYLEDDPVAPANYYAVTKLAAEQVVQELVADHLVVRGSIYGWNAQSKTSLAEWIVDRFQAGAAFPGFTDIVFSPLLVNSLGRLVVQLDERGARGGWHVASRDTLSKYDFAVRIAETFGWDASICQRAQSTDVSFKAQRPKNTSLQTGKIETFLGEACPAVREDLIRFCALSRSGYRDRLRKCQAKPAP